MGAGAHAGSPARPAPARRRRHTEHAAHPEFVTAYGRSSQKMKWSDKLGYLRYLVDKRGMKPVYLIVG
ncbi:MAG TPA: hypothetical protein VF057_06105, partial [Thermoanaerobaculia bacterium]